MTSGYRLNTEITCISVKNTNATSTCTFMYNFRCLFASEHGVSNAISIRQNNMPMIQTNIIDRTNGFCYISITNNIFKQFES